MASWVSGSSYPIVAVRPDALLRQLTAMSYSESDTNISPPLVSSPVVRLLEAGCPRPRLIT
jgi:hypothetical protein